MLRNHRPITASYSIQPRKPGAGVSARSVRRAWTKVIPKFLTETTAHSAGIKHEADWALMDLKSWLRRSYACAVTTLAHISLLYALHLGLIRTHIPLLPTFSRLSKRYRNIHIRPSKFHLWPCCTLTSSSSPWCQDSGQRGRRNLRLRL